MSDDLELDALLARRRELVVELADVDAALERQRHGNGQASVGTILNIEDAAKHLNTTVDALYRKRRRLRLGYLDPLDGKVKFTEAELDEYARRQRRG